MRVVSTAHKFIMSTDKKQAPKPGYTALDEWEIKTLIQDVETSGLPLFDVTLSYLESNTNNLDFYGTARNPKYKARRKAISSKLQDMKGRTDPSYLKYVRGYGVEPSRFTIDNAQAVLKKAKASEKKLKEPKDETNMENVSSAFNSFGLDVDSSEDEDFVPPKAPKSPPKTFSMSDFGTHMKSPELSPTRNSKCEPSLPVGPPSVTSSTLSSSTFTFWSAMPAIPHGSYERPDFFKIIRGHSGRYNNGIWAVEENKMVKEASGKTKMAYAYCGYLFFRGVDPPDVTLFTCFIADPEYVELLVKNKIVSPEDADSQFVVFREPMVSAFDRVGKGGVITHQWVAEQSKEAMRTVHTNIRPASEQDNSPGPSWYYSVAMVPRECPLDNRVFSYNNYTVEPYESMPAKTKLGDLDNEETLAFHMMWRIALEGTETVIDENETMTLAERMKKRRQEHK